VDDPVTQRDLANAVQGATLSVQLAEVIKDIADLRRETQAWQDKHEAQHVESETRRKEEARDRKSGRRWMIGTVISMFFLLVAIFGLVLQLYARTRLCTGITS